MKDRITLKFPRNMLWTKLFKNKYINETKQIQKNSFKRQIMFLLTRIFCITTEKSSIIGKTQKTDSLMRRVGSNFYQRLVELVKKPSNMLHLIKLSMVCKFPYAREIWNARIFWLFFLDREKKRKTPPQKLEVLQKRFNKSTWIMSDKRSLIF